MDIGILGCGKIAQKHINALQKFDHTEVTLGDQDTERARRMAREQGVDYVEDHTELLSDPDIEVIDVCTPVTTHRDIILEAVQNAKHVFCEKPLCLDLNEAHEIKGAAQATNKVVMVGYLYRFHPAIQEAKRLIDEGVIGEPYYGNFRLGARGSHRAWKHKADQGGGVINEITVHKLDLICWFFEDIKEVDQLVKDVVLEEREIEGETIQADAEDLVLADVKTERGRVTCHTDLLTSGFMEFIEVMGTNGSIFTSILDYLPTIVHLKESRGEYDQGQNLMEFGYEDLFEHEFEAFFEAIEEGKQSLNSVTDSIKILECVEQFKGNISY